MVLLYKTLYHGRNYAFYCALSTSTNKITVLISQVADNNYANI